MNINSLLKLPDSFGNLGIILNTEESIVLYNTLLVLQNENHFQNVYLWGKIFGSMHDYYVAYGYTKDILKDQVFYYSTNCTDWGLLPPPTKYAKNFTQLLSSQFQGDPSLVVDVLCEKDDPVTNKIFGEVDTVKRLKEEDRLSATVEMINEEAWIVPRGALLKRFDAVTVENKAFEGLTDLEAREKKSYLHMREPRQRWNANLLTRKDYSYALDFLDTIQPDIPDDSWTLQIFQGTDVVIRSLHWPGFRFYHRIATPLYGCSYFGNGSRNIDVPFMV